MGNIGKISSLRIKEMRDDLTLEDLANSHEFEELLRTASQAVLTHHNRHNKENVVVGYDEHSELTACTDSRRTLLNLAHPVFYETPDGKGKISIKESAKRSYGIKFHETGHVIYTCFSELYASINRFKNGKMARPSNMTKMQKDAFEEILELMKDKGPLKHFMCDRYAELSNCIEDARMESLLLANDYHFAGMIDGLNAWRAYHKASASRWDMTKKDIPTFMNLCLIYAKYHYVGNYPGGFEEFERSKPIIDRMLLSSTAAEFSEGVILLILNLWPKVKELIDSEDFEQQSGQSSEGSSESSEGNINSSSGESSENSEGAGGSGESSPGQSQTAEEKLKEVLEKLSEEIEKRLNNTTENTQDDEEEAEIKAEESETAQEKKSENSPQQESSIDSALNNILNNVAEDKARQAEKQKQNQEIKDTIKSKGKGFANYNGTQITEQKIPIGAERTLKRAEKSFGNSVMKAAREIERHFETDMRTRIAKNKYSGRKFYANKLVNQDYRYFGDKGRKKDVPRMKVGVVVDESGSMSSDDRYIYARAAAIALYEIFENISQMDIAIYGHSTRSNVEIFPYVDFGIKERNVKQKLCNIQARSGNIDIVPITCMAENLLKENGEIKLLFIITDGLPYSWVKGMTPEEELTKMADEYTRKGIEIVVAAMGEDKERIKEIYKKQRFLDISSPEDLPRELVQVIKRKL